MRRPIVLVLTLLLLLMFPGTTLAVDEPHLFQDAGLTAIADEAAESLGWTERSSGNEGDGIVVSHWAEVGTCQEDDTVSPNTYTASIWIWAEGSPEEAEEKSIIIGGGGVTLESFHEFNAYRAGDDAFSWAMANVVFSVSEVYDCMPDGQSHDVLPIAEAVYAAAMRHGLGTESTSPAIPTTLPVETELPLVDGSPTPTFPTEYALQGTVTDGHGNPVRYAKVRLTFGVHQQFDITDANGRYQFTGLPTGAVAGFNPQEDAYRVTVMLQYAPDGGAPLYQVLYGSDNGPLVAPVSKAFPLDDPSGVFNYDIDFGNPGQFQLNLLENIDPNLPSYLDDLAAVYVHTSQAVDLADQLGQEISRPFNVVAFASGQSGACWYGRNSNGTQDWNTCLNLSKQQYGVAFGETDSMYANRNRPHNLEWHEFGHHFLADGFGGLMPSYAGRWNHKGYYVNTRSTDAWTEGFAEFFALMVGRQIVGDPKFMEYKYGVSSVANLEVDYRAWNFEELAAAGLLLDLVDDADDYPSAKDDDQISIPVEDVWTIISKGVSLESDGNGHIFDMVDLYNNLSAWEVGSEDLDNNGRADLNDVFIAHGYFDDNDSDGQYISGDRIAYTSHPQTRDNAGNLSPAMPDRRDAPDIPGAYIATTVTNDMGSAVPGAVFKVDVLLDPPFSHLNVSYTVPAEALPDGRLYMILPPPQYLSHVRIAAMADGYQESDPIEITGVDFWSKVPNSSDQPLFVHTFTLKSQNTWVIPVIVIGTLGLCGLGVVLLIGLVLWRRRPLPQVSPQRNHALPADPVKPESGTSIWLSGFLFAGILGICCLVLGLGGWLAWRNNPLSSAIPTGALTEPPTDPTTIAVVPSSTDSQPTNAAGPGFSPDLIQFQDDFSNPSSGWDDFREGAESNAYYFEDEYLVLIHHADYYAWANPHLNFPGDVQVEVDARKIAGSQFDEFGLTCRYVDNSDRTTSYYYFAIAVDGLGVIYKVDHDQKSLVISDPPKNRSDVIRPDDQVNRIRADCIGDRLSLYVNGEFLIDAVDSSLGSGDAGLRADSETGDTEIRFDNFIVYKPGE